MNYKRKMYKNIDVIFWFIMMSLPLIITLIWFIGAKLIFNSGIATASDMVAYQTNSSLDFSSIFGNVITFFNGLVFPFLKDMFSNLFNLLSVTEYISLGILFGWFCSVQFMHLMFDFIVWLPKLADKYLHRFEE